MPKKSKQPIKVIVQRSISDYLIALATIVSLFIATLAILQYPQYPLFPFQINPEPLSHECYVRGTESFLMPICRLEYSIKMPTFSFNQMETVAIPFNYDPVSFWESPVEQTTGTIVSCSRNTEQSAFYCNLTSGLTRNYDLVIQYMPQHSETPENGKLQLRNFSINKEIIETNQSDIYYARIQNILNYPLKYFVVSFDLPKTSNKIVVIYDNNLPIQRMRGPNIWWNVEIGAEKEKTYEIQVFT